MKLVLLVLVLAMKGSSACFLYGVGYTPYRVPDTCPTAEEVEEDLQHLLKHSRRVRTYTTMCMSVNRVLLEYASRGVLSVFIGVWIDNIPNDLQEMDNLMTVLREYPHASIAGIAVGNEVAFRESMAIPDLVNLIFSVRHQVRDLAVETGSRTLSEVPVFTIDIIPIRALVDASDVVAVNIHPFYRRDLVPSDDPEIMANRVLEASAQQIDFYRNLAPTKQIVVTEIGWPTQSAPADVGIGNMEVSRRFMQKFSQFASLTGVQYYWFEMYDSLWKKPSFPDQPDSLSEYHWGLYYGDRVTPKFQGSLGC